MLKLLPKAKENLKKIIENGGCHSLDMPCTCCALIGFECDDGEEAERAREFLEIFDREMPLKEKPIETDVTDAAIATELHKISAGASIADVDIPFIKSAIEGYIDALYKHFEQAPNSYLKDIFESNINTGKQILQKIVMYEEKDGEQ